MAKTQKNKVGARAVTLADACRQRDLPLLTSRQYSRTHRHNQLICQQQLKQHPGLQLTERQRVFAELGCVRACPFCAQATEYHIGQLKARLAKLRTELQAPASKVATRRSTLLPIFCCAPQPTQESCTLWRRQTCSNAYVCMRMCCVCVTGCYRGWVRGHQVRRRTHCADWCAHTHTHTCTHARCFTHTQWQQMTRGRTSSCWQRAVARLSGPDLLVSQVENNTLLCVYTIVCVCVFSRTFVQVSLPSASPRCSPCSQGQRVRPQPTSSQRSRASLV